MKCLITKLNGVVNNELLPTLGELVFEVPANAPLNSFPARAGRGDIPVVMSFTNGNVFSQSKEMTNTFSEFTLSFTKDNYFWYKGLSVTSYIKIKTLYNLVNFGGDANSLNYKGITFKDMLIYSSNALRIVNYSQKTDGYISSDLSLLKDVSSLVIFIVRDKCITGDISSLGKSIGLQNISINNTFVKGKLESLLDTWKDKGKVSGDLSFMGNGIVTYNDEVIPDGTTKTITFSDSGYSVAE